MKTQYLELGELISSARISIGFKQQSDLALALDTTQQTVSRWEKGSSRPPIKSIQRLAELLKLPVNTLLIAAKYTPEIEPVVSFTQHFPIWSLSPTGFEDFICDLFSNLFPGSKTNKVGGPGDKQEGTDVEVITMDGDTFSIQCKRHTRFGPEKVKQAVQIHSWPATHKIIALARPASPQSRLEINKYPGWELWDVDTISKKVRTLSNESQIRLVDIYFSKRRFELLGINEAGPWQTSVEFFAGYDNETNAFNHAWSLVGRKQDLESIELALENPHIKILIVAAPGGCGKTRLLKQIVEDFSGKQPNFIVRFVSPTSEITDANLSDLGYRDKLIVIDDAHERDDLDILLQYASIPQNKATLLIATRTYKFQYIKNRAATFSLGSARLSEHMLEKLSLNEATDLAINVLNKFGGNVGFAREIASATIDCLLATVLGAQIVARENIPLEMVKNKDVFRSTLLGRFKDVIAGQIGTKADEDFVKKILNVISLIQPFRSNDQSVYLTIEKVESINVADSMRIVRLLAEAGVLFKRGGQYRISPDLLADHVIEEKCISLEGDSTGYAEQIFSASGEDHIINLLVNLGRLDWRLSNGDPSNSKLLTNIWSKLNPVNEYVDTHLNAVINVAYFQPDKALTFAENLIRSKRHFRNLPDLIRNAAYNIQYTRRACECLWELSKGDEQNTRASAEHAMQVLREIGEIKPNKVIEYSYVAFEFAKSLLAQESEWDCKYSPLEIFTGMLKAQGEVVTHRNLTVSFAPYIVDQEYVGELRAKVIDEIISLLSHVNSSISIKAARYLQQCMRYPIGTFGLQTSLSDRKNWEAEFVSTLFKIKNEIEAKNINDYTLIEIERSIYWFATSANDGTTAPAQEIINIVKEIFQKDLEQRITYAISRGYESYTAEGRESSMVASGLANDILDSYTNERLFADMEAQLERYHLAYLGGQSSAYYLMRALVERSWDFASYLINGVIDKPTSRLRDYVGLSLAILFRHRLTEAQSLIHKVLDLEDANLTTQCFIAYSSLDFTKFHFSGEEFKKVTRLLRGSDEIVLRNAIGMIRNIAKADELLAVFFARIINFATSEVLADEILSLFQENHSIPFSALTDFDVQEIFEKLLAVNTLEAYWIQNFISYCSKEFPKITTKFLLDRFQISIEKDDWSYKACNSGPHVHIGLRFKESDIYVEIFKYVFDYVQSISDKTVLFRYRIGELFSGMFGAMDQASMSILLAAVEDGGPSTTVLVSHILSEADENFVFNNDDFVIRLLNKASSYGEDILNTAIDAFFRSVISGVRSGTPGEPFPRDLDIKSKAEKRLQYLSRFSPAYSLYAQLKSHAEQGISHAWRERDTFED